MFILTMKLENRKLMVDDHYSTVGGGSWYNLKKKEKEKRHHGLKKRIRAMYEQRHEKTNILVFDFEK